AAHAHPAPGRADLIGAAGLLDVVARAVGAAHREVRALADVEAGAARDAAQALGAGEPAAAGLHVRPHAARAREHRVAVAVDARLAAGVHARASVGPLASDRARSEQTSERKREERATS